MKTRLYFAGSASQGTKTARELGAERRLYAYVDQMTIRNEPPHLYKETFFDSSAFSVWTGKVKIDIKQYGAYLLQHKDLFTVYANLDVIGDAKATEANQLYLESLGLHPLPTFHMKSDLSELRKLLEKYPYIGIGGMVGSRKAERDFYLRRIFAIWNEYRAQGRTVRMHGWGMTDFTLLRKYPFYSVDSSSWLGIFRFGSIPVLKGDKVVQDKNRFVGMKRSGRDGADKALAYAIHFYSDYIARFGIVLPEFIPLQ